MNIKVKDNQGNKFDLVEFRCDHDGKIIHLVIRDGKGVEHFPEHIEYYTVYIERS